MSNLEKMTGHTRLYRRNATYYHRAAVPKDIAKTYGKTKERSEALRFVRIKAVEIDNRFEEHRRPPNKTTTPNQEELTQEQIWKFGEVYYHYILDEDDDIRLDGFDNFKDKNGERIWASDIAKTPRETFEE